MAEANTERQDDQYRDFDLWPAERALAAMAEAQIRGVSAVVPAIPALAASAELAAVRMRAGGRLVYLGAGSSGLVALIDALELPQTFGIAEDRILVLMAGGHAMTVRLAGGFEDDAEAGRQDVEAAVIGASDCVLGISASGSTAYTNGGLEAARRAGAATIGIACNPNAALFASAEVAVLLESGPEVPAGSTRMAAGTAQKAALNLFSTMLAQKLGHVVDGLMVSVRADNAKLRDRAARIVARLAEIDIAEASRLLAETDWMVKPAVMLAAGAEDLAGAETMLDAAGGDLRRALADLGTARPA